MIRRDRSGWDAIATEIARRYPLRARKQFAIAAIVALTLAMTGAIALADSISPITFEPPDYHVGNINGQQGWMKTGPYDVEVADVSAYPAAAGYSFGTQALRLSDAVTSGSFGDQTFSPGLASPAGEGTAESHFDASFSIGTALATEQAGLHTSVSPDDGNGGRMSYLRFEDQANGVHVYFDDVTDAGPFPTVANFNETDIATLSRATAHSIRFAIDFKDGPANDVVRIYVDGALKITGTTWEDYYRYDPEQAGNSNVIPTTSKLLFRESGTANPANLGKGFLVDNVSLSSSSSSGSPTNKDECKKGGWQTFDNPTFKNQGDCVSFIATGGKD
jgi:hypothetical protein